MKKVIHSISLFLVSIFIAFCMAEIVARMALAPSNHMSVPMVPDDTLGTRVPEGALGYDEWGFRNVTIPDKADIVAIGDSQTFGINASIESSWPEQLEKMSSQLVYNLSSEGYGPVQYYHLFKTKGLKLQPEQIIVGYYIGNDPLNSYEMAYHNDSWSNLQNSEFSAKADTSRPGSLDRYIQQRIYGSNWNLLSSLDSWLAGRSMIYRLGFHNDYVTGLREKSQKPLIHQASYSNISLSGKYGSESFSTLREAYKMDLNNEKIQEGLRVTLELFRKMKMESEKRGIEFTVLLIPTKEMVFSHYLFDNDRLEYSDAIDRLLNSERMIREISMKYFLTQDINYIDALPTMQQAIDSHPRNSSSNKEYPNSKEHQLIAKSFYKYLESNQIANK